MPRLFVAASTQSMLAARGAATAYPFTISLWYNPTTSAAKYALAALTTSGANTTFCAVGVNATGNPYFEVSVAGVTSSATHASTVTNGQWCHILATATSTTSRDIYLNALTPVIDATNNGAPAGINQTSIGAMVGLSALNNANGIIAHVGIWNVVLDVSDIARLAKGRSPLRVRSSNLTSYVPVGFASPDVDQMSNTTFTLTGAPAVSTNLPPMSWYPPNTTIRPHLFSPGLAR